MRLRNCGTPHIDQGTSLNGVGAQVRDSEDQATSMMAAKESFNMLHTELLKT